MPTLDDFDNLRRERRDMRRKVFTVPLKILFTFAFGFYAFRFLQIDDPVDRKLFLLFVPIGFLIALMLKNSLGLQWYRKVMKYLIPIALILYGIYVCKSYIEHAYYYKLGAGDFFVLSLVFTNLFLMLFHREAASKGLPRFLLFSSLALLVLGFLLTYHIIIFGGSILLEPKGEITFRRTVFTTSDVKDLIEKYSKLSSIEISQLENDRFAMLLNLRGIIVYSPGVLPEEEFSDEFLKTHEDAVTRLKINLADNNFFFPSGLYKAKNYHDIKGYYLKDVLIRYTSEYSSKYRITLLFKKLDARNYYEFITYDRDDVDSTLTIPVQSKTLGNFTVNGKFKFQTNPETLSSNQTALEISYSHVSSSVPTQFTFFKPDIN